MTTIQGIDVSNWQGTIGWGGDWGDMSAALQWAYAKVSEGIAFRDPTFAANWRGMRDHGFVRGGYHFLRPDQGHTPEAEAQFFLDQLDAAGGLATGDFLVLDVEVSAAGLPAASFDGKRSGFGVPPDTQLRSMAVEAQPYVRAILHHHGAAALLRELATKPAAADETLAKVKAWLAYTVKAVGFRPLLYSGIWFMQPHGMLGDAELGQHGLILAAYQSTPPPPPSGWDFLAGWQYTDALTVPGINGPVDGDQFFGTTDQLRLYGKPAPPVPAPLVWDEAARLAFIEAVAAGVDVSTLQTTLAGYGG